MSFDLNLSIRGIQDAQAANLNVVRQMSAQGALGRANQMILLESHRYLVGVTHVDTGAYRASHRIKISGVGGRYTDAGSTPIRGLWGVIAPDPTARNPKSGRLVGEYALIEERRGGAHAAYGRTFRDGTIRAAQRAMRMLMRELDNG